MFWTNRSFTPADEDIEEEELFDEEAQLMTSMGLPLAFASSSDHRRAVSPEIFKKLKINNCMLPQYIFLLFCHVNSQDKSRRCVPHIICQLMKWKRKMKMKYSQTMKVMLDDTSAVISGFSGCHVLKLKFCYLISY